jgi:hypothetical protein
MPSRRNILIKPLANQILRCRPYVTVARKPALWIQSVVQFSCAADRRWMHQFGVGSFPGPRGVANALILHEQYCRGYWRWARILVALTIAMTFPSRTNSQTPSTGALTGVTLDPTGAVLPDVVVRLTNKDTGATASVTSDKEGRFSLLLLPPGRYGLQADRTGFDTLITTPTINVSVTETVYIELHLRLATVFHSVEVSAQPTMVQTNSSSLGRIVNAIAVTGLPLVTRNFAQIASLSPGVTTGVYNAGELGLGGTAL